MEETTTETTETTTEETQEVATRPDWAPEKFWNAETGSVDAERMAGSYKELERTLSSRPSGGVKVPTADSAPEEVQAFHRSLGVPENANEYELRPDELPEGVEWSDERASRIADTFHKHGVPPAAAKAIVADYIATEAENLEGLTQAHANLMAEKQTALKKEWGSDYNAKLDQVKRVVMDLGYNPDDAELFGNPTVISFLGKVAGKMSPDSVAAMRGTVSAGNGYTTPTEEARAIARDPNHPLHERYMSGDPDVARTVARLYNGG